MNAIAYWQDAASEKAELDFRYAPPPLPLPEPMTAEEENTPGAAQRRAESPEIGSEFGSDLSGMSGINV
jgi:hypothetical protein